MVCRKNHQSCDDDIVDSYDPSVTGGCVQNLKNHIRLLDQSLKRSSGIGMYEWIQQQQPPPTEPQEEPPLPPIATVEQLDADTRFGVLSHGTQADPIFNYGNAASLQLFEQTLEALCQTPSRKSTVPHLEQDRSDLIAAIERDGHGVIEDAIRVSAKGNLFRIATIQVWTVWDDAGTRIGLAAIYDRARVTPLEGSLEA